MFKLFNYKYYQIGIVVPQEFMKGHSYKFLQDLNKKYGYNYTIEKARQNFIKENKDVLLKILQGNKLPLDEINNMVQIITLENIQIHPYYKSNQWAIPQVDRHGVIKVNYNKKLIDRTKTMRMKYPDIIIINIDKEYID